MSEQIRRWHLRGLPGMRVDEIADVMLIADHDAAVAAAGHTRLMAYIDSDAWRGAAAAYRADGYEHGRSDAATALWAYLRDHCGPITGKGMTAGPVCVDEAVAIVEGAS